MFENEGYPNSDMEVSEKSAKLSRIVGGILLIVVFLWIILEIRSERKQETNIQNTQPVSKQFLLYFNPESSAKVLTDPEYCQKMKSIPDTLKGEKEIYFTLNSKVKPFYFDTVFGFNPICGNFKNPKFVVGIKEGDVVRFYDKELGPACYFYSQLTQDPAETSWWYYGSFHNYKTLSEGIVSCAGTGRIWKKKYDDMIAHGIVKEEEIKRMNFLQISIALYREYEYLDSGHIISYEQAYEEMNNIGY